MDITRIDLNLLVVLDALLSEQSVTRAAQRLHLAQPTVSNALARLRDLFQDPLLVRSGRAMHATHKASQLSGPLRTALGNLGHALTIDIEFDPRRSRRVFGIATTDYVTSVVMPRVLSHMNAHAPNMRFLITEVDPRAPFVELRKGDVDLVLGSMQSADPEIHRADLFSDKYVCVIRKNHPVVRGRISRRQFADLSHVVVRQQHGGAGGAIDEALGRASLQRSIVVSLPHFAATPYALIGSDAVMTVGSRIALQLKRDLGLQVLKHPLPLKPFVVSQFWHSRDQDDSGHAWLRGVLSRVVARNSRR